MVDAYTLELNAPSFSYPELTLFSYRSTADRSAMIDIAIKRNYLHAPIYSVKSRSRGNSVETMQNSDRPFPNLY
jgi:hypothetical protein